MSEQIVKQVQERYGRIAEGGGSCCGVGAAAPVSLQIGYRKEELEALPEEANLGLGCGAPLAFLALQPGETVLDLGSGPGLDALLAAREVGREGHVIGVDMTPEMLAKARANASRLRLPQVEFREGRLESLPVADGTVDAVTSNCVINLVPDKRAVFREVARVLRPGGRLVISDIVVDRPLPPQVQQDVLAWVGCVAGAMPRQEYFGLLAEAGLFEVDVLRDEDYLALLTEAAPEEARALRERWGLAEEDLAGCVRSVTYRARKA